MPASGRRLCWLLGASLPLALMAVSPQAAHARGSASRLSPDIEAVDAFAADDVWAVGAHYVGYYRPTRTVAQHWDGQTWTTVATPNPGKGQNELSAVSGVGPDDVWAVGFFWNNTGGPEHLLAEHWDGTAWTSVHVEQPDFSGHHHSRCRLFDVVAIATDDVWAVGYTFNGGPGAVLEHWDGATWSIVPNPAGADQLTDVTASASDDVWALGPHVLWHWDGRSWDSVDGPTGSLFDIVASSPTDAWIAGSHQDVWHWDGTSWAVLAPRHPRADWGPLSATSATDVWAVGERGDYPTYTSLVDHWDGTSWSTTALPRLLRNSVIRGISADAADDAWVFGRHGSGDQERAVVGHWDGNRWHVQE